MEYSTFTVAATQPTAEQSPASGISASGVITLAVAVAVAVVIKRTSSRQPKPGGQPEPIGNRKAGDGPGKSLAVPPDNPPKVSMDELWSNGPVSVPEDPAVGDRSVPEDPAVGDRSVLRSPVEKGRSVLSAPAVKAWAHRMNIPYELAQRLQKSAWADMCRARKLPGLVRGDVEQTPYGVAVHVEFRGSLDFPTVQRGVGQLETGLDVTTGTIRLRTGVTAGRGILDIRLRDPLADGVPWEQPTVPVRLAHPVRLAVTPFGDTLNLNLKQRIGVFGVTGSGKSCVQRLIGAHVAQAIDADLEIWDLKFGVESQHYAGKAHRVTTVDAAVSRVNWLLEVEFPRRAAKMKERGVSEWAETPWDPARVIIIDEGNALVRGFGEWREEPEEGKSAGPKGLPLKDLFTLVEQGRALGCYFVWATQYPKAASLPTEIRSQLNATVCLKLRTDGEARVVFGDDVSEGWAPQDLYGPGWLLVQDDAHTEPVDAKAVWLSVDTFRAVPSSVLDRSPDPDRAVLKSRTPGQSLYADGFGQSGTETGQDADNGTAVPGQVTDNGTERDSGTGDVSEDIWLVLSVATDCPGVSELSRRTARSKSAVHAAVKRMTEDGRVVHEGAGYRLRTAEED